MLGCSLLAATPAVRGPGRLQGCRNRPPRGRSAAEGFAPLLDVVRVKAPLHEHGLDDPTARATTTVSLVDAVSFAALRAAGAHAVFTYDEHLADEGFEVLG